MAPDGPGGYRAGSSCNDCDAKPVDFSRLLGKIEIELRHAGEMSRMRCQLK
jgi:hypothetical protein